MAHRREPVTIVSVFNDPDVRRDCLDRSLEAHRAEAPELEYIPVDNTAGAFPTAGAALNHGAAQARHEHVVFVHQDVYLHSLAAIEEAAGRLAGDAGLGMLGAVGPTAEGRFFGRVRDRVFLLGDPAPDPVPVDCGDEVLFMASRRQLEREPLPEDPELAWHAYAVEYGLRLRAQDRRVCVVDIPLTHNSLTVNLARLEVAYAAIAAKHPGAMPVMTPQGRVGAVPRLRDRVTVLGGHRWRYRWLRESVDAHVARRAAGGSVCLIGDIRLDVDDLIARLPVDPPLLVLNAAPQGFADERPGPLALTRLGRPVRVTSRPPGELADTVRSLAPGGPALLTNLTLDDVRMLAPQLPAERRVLGFRSSIGYWMLLGVAPADMPLTWRSRQARPLGMPALGA